MNRTYWACVALAVSVPTVLLVTFAARVLGALSGVSQ